MLAYNSDLIGSVVGLLLHVVAFEFICIYRAGERVVDGLYLSVLVEGSRHPAIRAVSASLLLYYGRKCDLGDRFWRNIYLFSGQ